MITMLREAAASARSQPIASLLTVLMVAGMVLTVMMTTGRTVAAEQQVLGSIDQAGTRTIQIRAEDAAGLTTDVLTRIRNLDGIEWAAAFSAAVDGTNTLIPDGTRVGVRRVYSEQLAQLGIGRVPAPGSTLYASDDALEQFGLRDVGGSVTLTTGAEAVVGHEIEVPDYLEPFQPLAIIPTAADDGAVPINVLLVIARSPELVGPLAEAVLPVLGAEDPTKVTVQTSEALAQLRTLVQSQLAASSRLLVIGLMSITAVLVAAILYGLVMMRRKDFGRRRALGATRGYIVTLLVTQTIGLAIVGIIAGLSAATVAAVALGDPLPSVAFLLALCVLSMCAALVAAIIPAVVASRREPIRELRVP